MGNDNNQGNVIEKDVIITVIEAAPGSGASFEVVFHKEFTELGTLLDLSEYFSGLVRNQAIRTKEPEPEELEPEDGSEI